MRPVKPLTISLLHATRGRPEMAELARQIWFERNRGDCSIEYIWSVDEDDPTAEKIGAINARKVTGKSRGNVDAYNRAAYASTGDVLVQVHDDVTPPWGWDRKILKRLDPSKPQVLHVSDGNKANPGKPWLLTILIATRVWVKKCGYMYHPDYVSVFCDDDISCKAFAEGAVVDARDLTFVHKWEGPDRDETQRRSYGQENWKAGKEVFERRCLANFPDDPGRWGEA